MTTGAKKWMLNAEMNLCFTVLRVIIKSLRNQLSNLWCNQRHQQHKMNVWEPPRLNTHKHTNTNFSMTSLGFSTSWRLSLTRALAATFTFICTFILKTFKNVPVPCLMHKSIHRSSPAVRVISNKHNCHPGIIFDCDSQIFLKLINKQLSDNRNDWMKRTALPVRHSVMYS